MSNIATIKDVAKLAKVSIATVSRVINNIDAVKDSTKNRVLDAISELNFMPNIFAKNLVLNIDDTVGVVVTDLTDTFFSVIVKAVDKVAFKNKKSLLIGQGYNSKERELLAINTLLQKNCKSIIVHSKYLTDAELAKYLDNNSSMVIINRKIANYEHRCIWLDNYLGAYLSTEHLIKLGHKNIAYIGSNYSISDQEERKQGYIDALTKYNITINPSLIVQTTPCYGGGEIAITKLLNYNIKITGLVTYNDLIAVGVMSILYDNNIKIPNDISIVGFDDMPIARYINPKLTTMLYPIELMSEYAANLALGIVDNSQNNNHIVSGFKPILINRSTTTNSNDVR